MKILVTLLLLTTSVVTGQTPTPISPTTNVVTATTPALADYLLRAGYGISPSASVTSFPSNKEGFISAGVKVTSSCYLMTTIDITATANTLRSGAECQMAKSGAFTLSPRIDGGLSFGQVSVASFAGGLVLAHPLPGRASGWNFTTELRVTANPGGPAGTVQLGLYIALSKGFFKN